MYIIKFNISLKSIEFFNGDTSHTIIIFPFLLKKHKAYLQKHIN